MVFGAAGNLIDPAGDRGADRHRVEGRRGQRHQDRQRVAGIGERRDPDLRLASSCGQVGRRGVDHVAHGVQDVVGVGVVVDFDHQPTQRALDMGVGHAGDLADRLFDHRGVLMPARERQQRVQVQVHSLAALPAHSCRGAVPFAVGRPAGAQHACGRLTHRIQHRSGQCLHGIRGRRHALCPSLQHLHCSTGDAADHGGYTWDPHYSPFATLTLSISAAWQSGGLSCTTKRGES